MSFVFFSKHLKDEPFELKQEHLEDIAENNSENIENYGDNFVPQNFCLPSLYNEEKIITKMPKLEKIANNTIKLKKVIK